MPYVIVDTNCLMRDYLLIEANMQTFHRAEMCLALPEGAHPKALNSVHGRRRKILLRRSALARFWY